ncbi:MAG TPA: hypothetical protein VHV30_07785, partial [Polyangiaceae bacterium]|nr:hypothetical protein [Polyangiaceae bacterium]
MRFNLRKSIVQSAAFTTVPFAGAFIAAIVASGCSSTGSPVGDNTGDNASSGGAADNGGDSGTVGLALSLPSGVSLSSVTWSVTGPNGGSGVVKSGTVDVSHSLEIDFTIAGIPTGSGYTITLTAQSTDGSLSCLGSATFTISPRMTTSVAVVLTCNAAGPDSGTLDITGQVTACATANGISALPGETTVGASVALSASASGASPDGIGYTWSAPSGTFSAPNAANTSFTCTAPGPVAVTLSVSAGAQPDGSACDPSVATTSTTILCDTDAGTVLAPDAGAVQDASSPADSGTGAVDSGSAADAAVPDGQAGTDSGAVDSSAPVDSGTPFDGGTPVDGGTPFD